MKNVLNRIEEGTTTVHDKNRIREILFGVLLIGIAIGIVVGFFLA